MIKRAHKWSRRLLVPIAALPILQATGTCDATGLTGLGGVFLNQMASSTFNLFVGSISQVLLQTFPSADVLQTLLGANPQPFFTG